MRNFAKKNEKVSSKPDNIVREKRKMQQGSTNSSRKSKRLANMQELEEAINQRISEGKIKNIGKSKDIAEAKENLEENLKDTTTSRKIDLSGFIDFKMKKSEGYRRSCLQDSMINAASIFGFDIRDQVYKEVPPYDICNSDWNNIMASHTVANLFSFKMLDIHGKKGGPEAYLLHRFWKTGVYVVLSRFINPFTNKEESHSFVYNADFTNENNTVHTVQYYGALIDNMPGKAVRVLQREDIDTVENCRKTLNKFFGVVMRINRVYKIVKKR